jgi:hypothetical protein
MDVVDWAKYMYKKLEEWERYGASLSREKKSRPCWRET